MIEEIELGQAHVSDMRQALLRQGSVRLMDGEGAIFSDGAKKEVLWHLDVLAAMLAGAHRHISNFLHDEIFNEVEKDDMQTKVVDQLRKDLRQLLPPVIKDYFYCLGKHLEDDPKLKSWFLGPQTGLTEELDKKREEAEETFTQLELLDRGVEFICGWLMRCRTAILTNVCGNSGRI